MSNKMISVQVSSRILLTTVCSSKIIQPFLSIDDKHLSTRASANATIMYLTLAGIWTLSGSAAILRPESYATKMYLTLAGI